MIPVSPSGFALARHIGLAALLAIIITIVPTSTAPMPGSAAEGEDSPRFIDLSLLVAPDYPCTWPSFPPSRGICVGPATKQIDVLAIDTFASARGKS